MSARTVEERCREWLRERGCPSVTECHASMAEFVTSLLAEAVAGERERAERAEADADRLAGACRIALDNLGYAPKVFVPLKEALAAHDGERRGRGV